MGEGGKRTVITATHGAIIMFPSCSVCMFPIEKKSVFCLEEYSISARKAVQKCSSARRGVHGTEHLLTFCT